MVLLTVDDSGYAVRVERPDKLRTLKSWLVAREEDEAMDAEGVLTQAEEANAMDPVG